MSRLGCKEARDQLEATRAAAGDPNAMAPAYRPELADHLQRCRACQGQLALGLAVDAAAAEAAEPLDELRAERIFAGVRRELTTPRPATVGRRTERPHPGRRPWALVLYGAAATATILLALFASWRLLDTSRPTRPDEPSHGRWLARASGVRAWATPGCEAGFTRREDGVELEVHRGRLLVAFDRQAAPGPLRVRTSEVEVVVRGTVFFVERVDKQTIVGVERGRVVVRPHGGGKQAVAAGELLRIGATRVERATLPPKPLEALRKRFGAARPGDHIARSGDHIARSGDAPASTPSSEVAPASASSKAASAAMEPRPATTPARHRSRSAAAKRRSPAAPGATGAVAPAAPDNTANATASEGPSVEAAVKAANQQLRRGDGAAAGRLLERALAVPGLGGAQREELQYLLATALRLQRRYREAARVLGALAGSSRSHAARLALLEQARLLAYKLGDRARAQELLARFVSSGDDALTQEAWLERCVLHLDQGARERAHRCLDGFLGRFKRASPARLRKARQIRSRIEALRSR